MKPSTTLIPKKRGPAPTGKGEPIMVRLQPDLLAKVDDAAKKDGVSRPEAVRRIIAKS